MRRRRPRKRAQASASARGYHYRHQKQREHWKPAVNAGIVQCQAPVCLEERDGRSRWIIPGTPWHLGHNEDRTAWTGPWHARCNLSEGATRGNRARTTVNGKRAMDAPLTVRPSRAW